MLLLPSTKSSHIKIEGFERPAVEPPELPDPVVVRHATARDERRIGELARLDDRRLPAGPFLVAEFGGETIAAMSLSADVVVADPFRRTADAVDLLRLRAFQLAVQEQEDAARAARNALRPAHAA